MTDREMVYEAVDRERMHQIGKWGIRHHSLGEWLLIMEGELNEAKAAWVDTGEIDGALCEVLQVVAVGVACLECHGIVERD